MPSGTSPLTVKESRERLLNAHIGPLNYGVRPETESPKKPDKAL